MATVHHPAFPADTRTVDDPAPWVASGWVLDEDTTEPPTPSGDTNDNEKG